MADFLGKYELRQVLGKGAMGTVYEGFDPIIARRVAIKTVRLPDADDHEAQEELARFKREAQAAGRLSHPNIVGVFDYGETPELAYIVMEFVDGTSLKAVVDKKERFELTEIARLMDSLMAGLQFSHDRGVTHRDIKPANIMLTKAGEVKIADFGIARIESSSMTQAGTMLGTPSYMSPEQFMGQTVDNRTDLYSSGVMLYQLLTGEKPFEGGLTAIMHKVLNTEPPPPSALSVTVPHSFDAVVKKAMAKRPEDRFATANDFAKAVRDAVAGRDAAPASDFGFTGLDDGDATMVATARPAARPDSGQAPLPLPPASGLRPKTVPGAKKAPMVALIGGGVVVLLAVLGGGGYFMLAGKSKPAPAASAPAASATPAAPEAAPTTPQIPPISAATRLAMVQGFGSIPCSLLTVSDVDTPKPVFTGLIGAGGPAQAIAETFASEPPTLSRPVNDIQIFDGPYCDVLNSIRPYYTPLGGTGPALVLRLGTGSAPLHDGQVITLNQQVPGFANYLETDYFSNDGSVFHITPGVGGGQTNVTEELGSVSAPYGTDMIISIASAAPLFTKPRPQDENASDYIPALRAALQNVVSAGTAVSVAAIPVITLPK